jgi:orotidine-5'-phosphate decarboxylase
MRGAAAQLRAVDRDSQMRDVPERMADRLIVALDVPTVAEADKIVGQLDGIVSFFKIGPWLFFRSGTDRLIDHLISSGKKVFLDYKMFDIPETVSKGVSSARDRGISFVTVHGDRSIIEAAVKAKGDELKVFTITVLTSMNDDDLKEMGYVWTVKQMIENRVRDALRYGSDGIIASAHDNPNEIRKLVQSQGLLIATPGIRPAGSDTDDHKRSATPADAIRGGADYVIMGRPILYAQDPKLAAQAVVRDMEHGLS